MFRKDIGPSTEQDKVNTLIGAGTEIKGTVKATGGLRVDGRVEGEVLHDGDLIIGEEGVIEANVKTRNATVAGEVRGNVEASGRVEIVSTGKILGDITVTTLIVNEGAIFDGNCQMRQTEAADARLRRSGKERLLPKIQGPVEPAKPNQPVKLD